jgi:isopenicillin-N N-acyltransferase like protein
MYKCVIISLLTFLLSLQSCAYWRVDPYHVLIRSDIIQSPEDEQAILEKAYVTTTEDKKIKVIYVQGTPYERGYQHGVLLRKEVQDNLGTLYKNMLKTFRSKELFAEAFERLRPFIPAEYIEEMHGLAHGSKLPLEVIHHIHALPSITEWGGKKRLKELVRTMIAGEDLGTSCSNFSILPESNTQELISVRILDWGLHRISKLHEYPLISVSKTESGAIAANIGWIGFLGAVSGLNASGITLGEMGYGDPDNETLRGKPMVFLLREVLDTTRNLAEVRSLISNSPGTNSFGYVMSDGKSNEAEMYIRDRDRFLVFAPGIEVRDTDEILPAISNIVYGGHYEDRLHTTLSVGTTKLNTEVLINHVIPEVAMKSNFQNVIYFPTSLSFWVSNAPDKDTRAAEAAYSFFSLKEAIKFFDSEL